MIKEIKSTIKKRLYLITLLSFGMNMLYASSEENPDFFTESYAGMERVITKQVPISLSDSLAIEDFLFYTSLVILFFVWQWYRSYKEKKSSITY